MSDETMVEQQLLPADNLQLKASNLQLVTSQSKVESVLAESSTSNVRSQEIQNSLKEELRVRYVKIEELLADKTKSENELQTFRESTNELQHQIRIVSEKDNDLVDQLAKLENQLSTSRDESSNLSQQLETLQNAISSLQTEKQETNRLSNEESNRQNAKITELSEEIISLKTEILSSKTELKSVLDQSSTSNAQNEERQIALNEEFRAQNVKIEELISEKTKFENELQISEELTKELQNQIRISSEKDIDFVGRFAKLENEADVKAGQETSSQLEATLSDVTREFKDFANRYKTLQSERDFISGLSDQHEAALVSYKAESKESLDRLQNLESKTGKSSSGQKERPKKSTNSKEILNKQKKEFKPVKKSFNEEHYVDERNDFEETIASLTKELENAKRECPIEFLAKYQKAVRDRQSVNTKLSRQTSKIRFLEIKKSRLETKHQQSLKEISGLKQSLKQTQTELSKLQQHSEGDGGIINVDAKVESTSASSISNSSKRMRTSSKTDDRPALSELRRSTRLNPDTENMSPLKFLSSHNVVVGKKRYSSEENSESSSKSSKQTKRRKSSMIENESPPNIPVASEKLITPKGKSSAIPSRCRRMSKRRRPTRRRPTRKTH